MDDKKFYSLFKYKEAANIIPLCISLLACANLSFKAIFPIT